MGAPTWEWLTGLQNQPHVTAVAHCYQDYRDAQFRNKASGLKSCLSLHAAYCISWGRPALVICRPLNLAIIR